MYPCVYHRRPLGGLDRLPPLDPLERLALSRLPPLERAAFLARLDRGGHLPPRMPLVSVAATMIELCTCTTARSLELCSTSNAGIECKLCLVINLTRNFTLVNVLVVSMIFNFVYLWFAAEDFCKYICIYDVPFYRLK